MPLAINREVFITCAITGSGDTVGKSDLVPVSPRAIAADAMAAAKAGAAIVHCHVRDPQSGKPSRAPALFREVTERIRDSQTDVVLNLTAGMGGDLVLGGIDNPLPPGNGTDMAGAAERLLHIAECRPEICTLDCGTMNFGHGDYVMTNTPAMLRAMAAAMTKMEVRPEIEVFDSGHLWFGKQLITEGAIAPPALWQLCMGIPWGAPDDMNTLMAMVNNLPPGDVFSAFSIGKNAQAYPAAAVLCGGNVRVGLEDNLYLSRGVLASNAQLVERAATIVSNMGARILSPAEVRDKLKLTKRAPAGK